MTQMQSPT